MFLCAMKSELIDPKNRNQVECNLPSDELEALKILIQLQRDRIITIKPCDKGAGVIILDFEEYVNVCNEHLNLLQENPNDEMKPFYHKIDSSQLDEAKIKIKHVLEEALDNKVITNTEYEAMNPENKNPGKFYCTFKVHKDHEEGRAPPPRPIISGCGSIIENIGVFVEYFVKNEATKHRSYLQDTPDFLRQIEVLNKRGILPINAILVTADVCGLFTNIPHQECIQTTQCALNERTDPNMSTEFIIRLLELILKYNIFEYNGDLYQQDIGTAMGSRPAPSISNICMANKIDNQFIKMSIKYAKYGEKALIFLKRFLDDLFFVFCGSTKRLHEFMEEVNTIHPNMKFTMKHTFTNLEPQVSRCQCPLSVSIPFLDTSCMIKDGQIIVDLYRKPSDRNRYLLPDSCHPDSCKKNIPFSLAMRITRICSEIESREIRYNELLEMLLERNYPVGMVKAAINKARSIPRHIALRPVARDTTNKRPVFVVSWDPRLPSISAIQNKHWRSMSLVDPYLKEVFPDPPLVAYKRQKNIRDYTIRAKVPPLLMVRPRRVIPGMRKCHRFCLVCPYIKEGKEIKGDNFTWKINKSVTCDTYNFIYLIECNKENCKSRYIGESERKLRERIMDHKGYITNKKINQATGAHFNLPGHSIDNLTVTIVEKVKKPDAEYRKEREKYFIRKFNTFYRGMNRMT